MMANKTWSQRPPDVANLFNPAFCTALLNRIAAGHQALTKGGLPYPLAFVALPMILHPATEALLPATSHTRFHSWLLDNPSVIFGFSDRARAIAPIVREAISFGLRYDIVQLGLQQTIIPVASREFKQWANLPNNAIRSKNAQTLGKLLAQVNDVPTIFALFGVRP